MIIELWEALGVSQGAEILEVRIYCLLSVVAMYNIVFVIRFSRLPNEYALLVHYRYF